MPGANNNRNTNLRKINLTEAGMQPNFYEANKADGRAGATYIHFALLSKLLEKWLQIDFKT
ncbi:hypothetical protein [Pedobacter agri]|uniref:hypothetical protein n=1 Tax=Pedobacter agri TaxID=454586 RepID=UPI0029303190|nr:hypothetical protein [Pedobacter agri]